MHSEIAKTPVIGKNIGLTIDSQIQHVAEEAIAEAVVKNHGEHGSIVAMDPNTRRDSGAGELPHIRSERAPACGRSAARP